MTARESLQRSIEAAQAMRKDMVCAATEEATIRGYSAKWDAFQDSIDEIDASIIDMKFELLTLTEEAK